MKILYGLIKWRNGEPVIDGAPVFHDRKSALEYLDNLPGETEIWTIAELNLQEDGENESKET